MLDAELEVWGEYDGQMEDNTPFTREPPIQEFLLAGEADVSRGPFLLGASEPMVQDPPLSVTIAATAPPQTRHRECGCTFPIPAGHRMGLVSGTAAAPAHVVTRAAEYESLVIPESELAEDLGPEQKFTDVFPAAEHLDWDATELAATKSAWEWAKISFFDESLVGGAVQEKEFLDSAKFNSIALDDFKALGLMRAVAKPGAHQANYEFRNKFRIYYPGDGKSKSVAGKRAFPVVVITHGMHNARQGAAEIDSYLGYGYLQAELARHGIISISISSNPANILDSMLHTRVDFVQSAMRILKTLHTGNTPFRGRLNLHKMGLMGHSRGGDAVVKAAIQNRGNSDVRILAVCSLAPTDFTGEADPKNRVRLEAQDGLRYLVLYGSHDGDVFPGDGFRHYDRATCERTMAFVKGMKHDRFNTNWNNMVGYCDPFDCSPTDVDFLTEADHQQLAIDYIAGLFRLELNHERSLQPLFDGSLAPSGAPSISLQWSPPLTPRTLQTLWGSPLKSTDRWGKGWTTLMPGQLPNGVPFELAYKIQTGEVSIDTIHADGSGTDPIWTATWNPGWSTFMPFQLPGDPRTCYLAYKSRTGEASIDRIGGDGKSVDIGLWKEKWTAGWTTFMPFSLPGDNHPYYLAYKVTTGEVSIDRIATDGKSVDAGVWKAKWTPGWTAFVPFAVPGDDRPYYLAYKAGSGEVSIDRIWRDGKGVDARIWQDRWTSGWTTFMPFRLPGDDRLHYLAYKAATGEVSVDRIAQNGTGVDIRIWTDQWSKNWSHFMPFELGGKPHFQAYKESTGEVALVRVFPDRMQQIDDFEGAPGVDSLGGTVVTTSTTRLLFENSTALPSVPHQTGVLRCDAAGAKYNAQIPPGNRNFNGFDLLTLRLASQFKLDSAPDIAAGSLPDFKVRITYGAGAGTASAEASQAQLDLRGVRARQRPIFRMICEGTFHSTSGGKSFLTPNVTANMTKTVLQTLFFPLSAFRGVNWQDVRAVEFEAGSSVSAPLYLDSLAMVQS